MGLFDKKFCDVCGEKIGLLGNRKLEDGNLCKDCAGQLSPFFSERRQSSVAEIKEQLAYRESNKEKVAAFNVTRTLGDATKVMLDEDACRFIVSRSARWQQENPDVLDYAQVTGCQTEIRESRRELKYKDKDGKEVGYNPRRYDIDYDFWVTIHINSPWFNEIEFRVNPYSIEQRGSVQYREAERQASEIKAALTSVRQEVRDTIAAANAPKAAVTCPFCGATTMPDASGCCEFCGGAVS